MLRLAKNLATQLHRKDIWYEDRHKNIHKATYESPEISQIQLTFNPKLANSAQCSCKRYTLNTTKKKGQIFEWTIYVCLYNN